MKKRKSKGDLLYEVMKHKANETENVYLCKRSDGTVEEISAETNP